jgi:hypothetical protein
MMENIRNFVVLMSIVLVRVGLPGTDKLWWRGAD